MESIKELYKIGPGPSSSHTIGPKRACEYILDNFDNIEDIHIVLYGSLALTGKGHLTDKIIDKTLQNVKHSISFDYETIKRHPNTMDFNLTFSDHTTRKVEVVSIGGGSIVIDDKKDVIDDNVYPFKNFSEIKEYCLSNNLSLADVVYKYDSSDIKEYLNKVYDVMTSAISHGLNEEGYLPGKLHVLRKAKQLYSNKENSETDKIRLISSYAFAVSEENANGKDIVTAPTCGSSGVLPAVLKYLQDKDGISKEKIIDALAVAGIVGNVIKSNASISGASAGCQSEVGSACSMAAASVAYLNGQSLEEIEYAAEIALEHHLGLTCDPIDGLVQIPCIERNAVAALRAVDSAYLAKFLNGTRRVSFDMVVQTMYETGKDLSYKYKETSTGGLAKNFNK